MRKKSIEELKKTGTYRADRHAKREAAGNLLIELPAPPFALADEAAQVYNEEGTRLIKMKMLKPSDLRLLAMYATEMGVYISEMQAAQEEGITVVLPNGISAASAHRRAAEQALKLASGLADKLGLNPASRARLKGDAAFQNEGRDENDPLAFLNDEPEEESYILRMMRGRRPKPPGN